MKLGTAIYTYIWECPLEEAVERCARFGFDTLEVMTTPPFLWPAHFGPYERRRLRRIMKAAGVRVFSLNPTFLDLNLISLNPAIRKASLEDIKENIRLAADLEAELVVVAAGRRHPLIPAPLEDAQQLALDALGEALELAEKLGVILGLENVPNSLAATASDQLTLLEKINRPHFQAVYDMANGYMVEDPAEGVKKVAPFLKLVHYSDTHKTAWGHLPVGYGEVDFAACTRSLNELKYDGLVILETTYAEDPDGGIRHSLEQLEPLGLRP